MNKLYFPAWKKDANYEGAEKDTPEPEEEDAAEDEDNDGQADEDDMDIDADDGEAEIEAEGDSEPADEVLFPFHFRLIYLLRCRCLLINTFLTTLGIPVKFTVPASQGRLTLQREDISEQAESQDQTQVLRDEHGRDTHAHAQ